MRKKEKQELIFIRKEFADIIRKEDNTGVFDIEKERKLLIRIDQLIYDCRVYYPTNKPSAGESKTI